VADYPALCTSCLSNEDAPIDPTSGLCLDCLPCTCPHEYGSFGTLHGMSMGSGMQRVGLTPGCPEHDSCHHFTAEYRATRPEWSDPWCPIHDVKDCPE
jgi:hypothetical protein